MVKMWMIIAVIIYFVFMLYLRGRMMNRKGKEEKWKEQTFNRYQSICVIDYDDGLTLERPHKRFEYVGQTVNEGVIVGIYVNWKLNKKERKYEKLCEKWR